jgi:cytochrome c-type biogenesis protein CcmH/NrfG
LVAAVEGATSHYYLGIAYEQQGRLDRARDQYRIFAKLWEDADPGREELTDTRRRLEALEAGM